MKKETDYLENAIVKEYSSNSLPCSNEELKLIAKPFITGKLPSNPKRLLTVGLALNGQNEIRSLRKYFADYKIYGIDLAKSAVKQELEAELSVSDIANLSFKDNFFSGILCSYLFHEVFSYSSDGIKKVKKALSESSRTLTKGGLLFIQEFFIPNDDLVEMKLLTKESIKFSKKFIRNFRKTHDSSLRKKYKLNKNSIISTKRLIYELMIHYQICKMHFKSSEEFFASKEIEEQYLPISITDYFQFANETNLEIVKIEYNDHPKSYPLLEKHFKVIDKNKKKVKNQFGSIDLLLRKK